MKVLPASGSDWFALLLLPFKVFVPAGWLMITLQTHVDGYYLRADPDLLGFVLEGYFISFWVLVVGAMIQRGIGTRRDYLSTCGFVIALFAFGFLILPYMAYA